MGEGWKVKWIARPNGNKNNLHEIALKGKQTNSQTNASNAFLLHICNIFPFGWYVFSFDSFDYSCNAFGCPNKIIINLHSSIVLKLAFTGSCQKSPLWLTLAAYHSFFWVLKMLSLFLSQSLRNLCFFVFVSLFSSWDFVRCLMQYCSFWKSWSVTG